MSQCWYENPAHRPAFGVIRHQLDVLLGHHRNYLDLDNLDMVPPSGPSHSAGAAAGAVGGRWSAGTAASVSVPTSLQLVCDLDDDDDGDRDSYVDSSPLVVDVSRSRTSTSSSPSTNDQPLDACTA